MANVWSERAAELQQMLDAGMSYGDIAQRYGAKRHVLRSKLHQLRAKGIVHYEDRPIHYDDYNQRAPVFDLADEIPVTADKPQEVSIAFPDKKVPQFDLEDWMNSVIDMQSQLRQQSMSQKEATIHIDTDQPFAISFSADWHIGSAGVDYTTMFRHFKTYLRVPNLYVGLVGDMMDNFIKTKIKSGMLHALFGPAQQQVMLAKILEMIGQKTLFYTSGNHDSWSDGEAGIDLIANLLRGLERGGKSPAPYLRNGGGINLVVNGGEVNYRLFATHKYRFKSTLNATHSPKRMHEIESPYDVGVVAHVHQPSIEHTQRWTGPYGKDCIHMVCGTYKVDDNFAAENGYGQNSYISCPTVIFFPHEKRMIPFRHLEDAVVCLEAMTETGKWRTA